MTMPSGQEPQDLVVPLDLLRNSFDVLLRHVREVAGDEVRLPVDSFWSLFPQQLYDVERPATSQSLGSLDDCLHQLERIAADHPDDLVPYGMVWLADVLRAVGHFAHRGPEAD
ncbi:hypothetical protein [Geodermatophilus sp. SYSU D01119]